MAGLSDGWVSKGWARVRGVRPGRWLVVLGIVGPIAAGCGAAERNEDATDADTSSAGGSSSSATGSTSSATGGDTSSSTGTAGDLDLETVLEFMAVRTCESECASSFDLLEVLELFYNQDCLHIYRILNQEFRASFERSIAKGTVSFDAAQAQRCLDDLAQAGCETPASAACLATFVGHVPEAGACTDTMECAGGGYCNQELACPGVCEPRGSVGAPCEGSLCALDLVCSAAGICELSKANGEACTSSSECLSGYCNDDDVCAEATENFSAAEGHRCHRKYECQLGLYCDTDLEEPVCVPAPKLGEACRDIGLVVSCANVAFCDIEAGEEGVCVEREPVGAPCEFSEECATMVCDGGTCQELSRVGEPCVTDERCFGVCESGVCAPTPECDVAGD